MSGPIEQAGAAPDPFTPDAVAAIIRHMNVDHPEDTAMICRAHGGVPDAAAATMTGLDADGGDYLVVVDGREVPVRVPWGRRLTERAQVRAEVVRLYDDACAVLGLPARRPHVP